MSIVNNKEAENKYEENQTGWIPSILLFIVIAFISLAYFNEWGNSPLPLAGYVFSMIVPLLVFLSFYKMKVVVEHRVIRIIFGIGIIRIKIEFDEIMEVQTTKTSWYQGLGIRITGEGMLYNIHGTDAVKVSYVKAGAVSSVQIGSAHPDLLRDFLLPGHEVTKSTE